jgi:hypothetical protein
MKNEVGVTKETYWIRLSIAFLYVIAIFGLGIVNFRMAGWSLFSIAGLHTLYFALYLLYWYQDRTGGVLP